jgi:CheY-like chemotaxis protein
MRVLVVDGDPAGAREMETILRAAGHELVDATAGPDVVFLDHDLGIEMARRLRERCRGRIVLRTTRTDARTLAGIESFRPAGMLAKPFTAEQVLAMLARAVA